jgi:hypothetical protein
MLTSMLHLLSTTVKNNPPDPVAARYKAWVCSRLLDGIVGSNSAGGMDACCECYVLSSRGLFVRLIIRPEEFY